MAHEKILLGTVSETEAAFYDALSRADINALMMVWADEENIICIHPGAPRLVGHAAIRDSWAGIFERGGVQVIPMQLHATQNSTTTIHNVVEEVYLPEINQQGLHIVATNVYVNTPLGWRMTLHHASVAPGKIWTENAAGSTMH